MDDEKEQREPISYYHSRRKPEFLVQAVRTSWVVLFTAIGYQVFFYPEITNIIAMIAVVFAWFIATRIWLKANIL